MAASDLYVLLPHCCFESVATATAKLLDNEEYLKGGSEILDCPKGDPAFAGIESSLSLGFDDCPKLDMAFSWPIAPRAHSLSVTVGGRVLASRKGRR